MLVSGPSSARRYRSCNVGVAEILTCRIGAIICPLGTGCLWPGVGEGAERPFMAPAPGPAPAPALPDLALSLSY